jgi:DNA-binding protein YbaB
MDVQNKQRDPEQCYETLPPPERTAELLAKATELSSWISALKQRSRQRPFVGKSEDGRFVVVLRDCRIESLNADESLGTASAQEIISLLCEAHNDAIDNREQWFANQCEALAKAAGITGDFELPF